MGCSKYPNHRTTALTNAIVATERYNATVTLYRRTLLLKTQPHSLHIVPLTSCGSPSIYKLVNQGSICIHLRSASPSRSLDIHSLSRLVRRLCRWASVRWCGVGLRENIVRYLRISQTDLVPGHACSHRRQYIRDQARR